MWRFMAYHLSTLVNSYVYCGPPHGLSFPRMSNRLPIQIVCVVHYARRVRQLPAGSMVENIYGQHEAVITSSHYLRSPLQKKS